MPIYRLPREIVFPKPDLAEPSGLLAVGGDLSPKRLLAAYAGGIFPWFSDGQPILWWSPDPRMVLEPARLHVPRSLAKTMRAGRFEVRVDTAFRGVIEACARKDRPGQDGTWITDDMAEAYLALHELGWAHSFEAWQGAELVGGLYGVSIGSVFYGESMFADAPDASKVAFATAVGRLAEQGCDLIDCQQNTAHLARFGAAEIPRAEFLARLAVSVARPTRRGKWTL